MTTNSKVVYIGTDTLQELLLASYAQITGTFSQDYPTIHKMLREAQSEARQALGWAEYDMEIEDD
jgi:hypothetical protein